jgi:hypothetical protein
MQFTTRVVPILALALSGVAAGQAAQSQPPAEQLQKAGQAFAAQQWPEVLAQYSDIVARFPTHALSRFRVGVAQLELGRLVEAERNLREGERLGVAPGPAAYRLGQVHGEAGRTDSAVSQLLRSASNVYFVPIPVLEGDPHLAKVKATSRWSEVVKAFDVMARPCMHDARYRELDFWIGEWDVRPSANPGAPPSESIITLEFNGCVIHEHWKPGNGAAGGESFNMFDRSFGQWRQTWVDGFGGQHDYRGKLEGKNMVYYGELPPPPGQTARSHTRLTFFNVSPDSVRQFGETSTDGGKTWSVGYDLMYVRRRKPR